MIGRPKRSKNRYTGDEAAGTEGITTLSSVNNSQHPDGRRMRKRMALAAAACLLVVAVIIGVVVSTKNKHGSSSSSSASSGGGGGGGSSGSLSGGGDSGSSSGYGAPDLPKTPSSAFELVKNEVFQELQSSAGLYKHTKSGMQVMTMIPKDPNQDATFGINFRTPTEREDGVQFVVQNAILAGSVNYPVKDPFNQVERGSLQTYWDTWTNRDRTSFVVASRNLADFRNNIKVMIDAVFHPLFVNEDHKWIFRQEGWRIESPDNKLLYLNGNAYTSAKAAQMDPQQAMVNQIYKNLFADHVYSKNPKGEAGEVVTLTYEELIEYYKTYYLPANGHAFCFGKQDFIDACLGELEPILDEYEFNEEVQTLSKVEWQDKTNLDTEKKEIGYPSFQDQVDYRSVVAWVLNDQPMDLRAEVTWHLLCELLVGSPSSPVSKAIVDLNLGDDVIAFFDHSLQQWVMALGVSGIVSEDMVEVARNSVIGKLSNIVNNGFSDSAITAALNKMQFMFREQSSTDMPRGVKTFSDVLSHWNYDRDPFMALQYPMTFDALKAEIEANGQDYLLETLTRRMFDSKHSTYLDLHPDKNYAYQYDQMETEWLANLDQYISKEQGMQMLAETAALKKVQDTPDSEDVLAMIPRLKVSDLNKTLYTPPLKIVKDLFDSGITTLEHELPFTNGIAYVDFAIDISNLEFDDVVLLPLFCRLLLEGGTHQYSDIQMQHEIDKASGGISVYPYIDEVVQTDSEGDYVVPDGKHLVSKIIVSGACVAQTCLSMLSLFKHILFDSDVRNKKKAIALLEEMIDDMEDDIQSRGHFYTTQRIASRYKLNGFIQEQLFGITQLMQMRRALAQIRNDFSDLSLRLIKMQDAMKKGNRNGMVMSVTGDHQSLQDLKGSMKLFLTDLLPLATQGARFPDFAQVVHPWVSRGEHLMEQELAHENPRQAIIVPTRVNHVAKGGLLYDIGERIRGSDMVVTSYLGGYYLYEELRYKLGALHAWAVLDADSGVMIYQSDDDPDILQTLDVYDQGDEWVWAQIRDGNELPVEAKSAIVGAIGRMDGTAMQPNRIGMDSIMHYLKQDSPANRQRWRDQILGSSIDDFHSMVERLGAWGKPTVCVITSLEIYNSIDPLDFNMSKCEYSGYSC